MVRVITDLFDYYLISERGHHGTGSSDEKVALHLLGDCVHFKRVSRKWIAINPNTDIVMSLDMLLLDAKGDVIWVQVPRNLIKRFDSKIKEQAIYIIAKFKVSQLTDNKKYRPVKNPLCIEFQPGTTIRPTDITQPIPRHIFRFIEHSDIPKNINNRLVLLDVVGLVKVCLAPITTTNLRGRSTRKEIMIMLLEGVMVTLVIWGRLITQLDEVILAAGTGPIILVISSVFVTKYNGEVKLSSSSATKFYASLELPEVAAFQQSCGARNHELSSPRFLEREVDPPPIFIEDLMSLLSNSANMNKVFTISGNVCEVMHNWCYDGCAKCSSKLRAGVDHFYCEKCNVRSIQSVKRFRFELSVIDSSAEALFVVLDHAAGNFFYETAEELYTSNDQQPTGVPSVIQNFQGLDVTLQVKLNSYTFKNPGHGFSVVKIVEPEGVHQLRTKTSKPGQHSKEGNKSSPSPITVVGQQSTGESILDTTIAVGHVQEGDGSLDGGVCMPLKRKLIEEE
ncbi:unnamed protein product [Linum trigynum]|uniref:Replication factor A C-terminal domain-containing protein n=1 Tax=Linum trigynum TaxID=586398 RepID=A0AAV2D7I7_9ROSI